MTTKTVTLKKFAVIGAGTAGLVACKTILEQGHSCVVFEASNHIGGYWDEVFN